MLLAKMTQNSTPIKLFGSLIKMLIHHIKADLLKKLRIFTQTIV